MEHGLAHGQRPVNSSFCYCAGRQRVRKRPRGQFRGGGQRTCPWNPMASPVILGYYSGGP